MSCNQNVTLKPDMRVLQVLLSLANKYGKQFVYPSQATIRNLLLRFHHIHMPDRTLNRHLAGLECLGYIERVRRHTHDKGGMLILKSTLYKIENAAISFAQCCARALENLSTVIVNKYVHHALPKTAVKARLVSLIMNHEHRILRNRTKWKRYSQQ